MTNARVARRARNAASEEAAGTFPALIAQAAALLTADVMEALKGQQTQPVCLPCAARTWRAAKEWEIAAKNAQAAAEPPPDKPDMATAQSFTTGARGPVCWPCFDPALDGPFDMADYLPPAVD